MAEDVDAEATIDVVLGATISMPQHPICPYHLHLLQVDIYLLRPSRLKHLLTNQPSLIPRSITTIGTCVTAADGTYRSGTRVKLAIIVCMGIKRVATGQMHRHT